MPIYEYSCPECGEFELMRRLSDAEVKFCPECGSEVERLISAPGGFEFKGKGFFHTDYKQAGAAVSERQWPGDKKGNNVVNLPKIDMYAAFDQKRTDERRTVKKEKNRVWKNKV